MNKSVLIILTGIIIGCTQDDFKNAELNNTEFEPYRISFLEEAKIRGHVLNANNIDFYFANIIDEDIGALCIQNSGEIIISKENWGFLDEEKKERLIFHELGHCILGRGHKNEQSESGDCFSIMKGTKSNLGCSLNIYSQLWREYYLDELFNKNTVLPNWYTDNQEYHTTYANQFDIVSIVDLNTDFYYTSLDLNSKEKFVIEFTFKDWSTASSNLDFVIAGVVFGGFFYSSVPLSETQQIFISTKDIPVFFQHHDYKFKNDIKLTIRKNNDLLQFFIDEQFMHAMEFQPFENNIIQASFDKPINMDIKIFEYN